MARNEVVIEQTLFVRSSVLLDSRSIQRSRFLGTNWNTLNIRNTPTRRIRLNLEHDEHPHSNKKYEGKKPERDNRPVWIH